MLALEVFSWAFGNAGATEVPNKMVIFHRIARPSLSFALSTRTKTDCTPAPRRIPLKCGLDANAMLALEVFSWAFGNAGASEVPNKMMIFTESPDHIEASD